MRDGPVRLDTANKHRHLLSQSGINRGFGRALPGRGDGVACLRGDPGDGGGIEVGISALAIVLRFKPLSVDSASLCRGVTGRWFNNSGCACAIHARDPAAVRFSLICISIFFIFSTSAFCFACDPAFAWHRRTLCLKGHFFNFRYYQEDTF